MDPRYIAMYTVEETCEMAGLILCIRALLIELADRRKQLVLAILPTEEAAR